MASNLRIVVIEPARRWPRLSPSVVWRERSLIYFMSWRDIKIRYKQTFVGFGWSVFQPLISMLAFTFVFSKLTHIDSEGMPYPVFVLAGLMPWTYFTNAVLWGSQSLVANTSLVTKVYFPRIVLPVSSTLTWTFDLGISFTLVLIMMAFYGIAPPITILLVPLLVLFVTITALSVSLWLSAVNVRYRDVGHVLPFLISIWLFLTPVVYPSSLISNSSIRSLYALNPMVGVVDSFRWALLGAPAPTTSILPSALVVLALLVSGWFYFLRTEQSFADVI